MIGYLLQSDDCWEDELLPSPTSRDLDLATPALGLPGLAFAVILGVLGILYDVAVDVSLISLRLSVRERTKDNSIGFLGELGSDKRLHPP